MVAECRAPAHVKRMVAQMRAEMTEKYGVTETTYWCRWCQEHHELIADTHQRQMIDASTQASPARSRRLPPMKPIAGWCRWHQTARPELAGTCPHCRSRFHVHGEPDAIGRPTWGRSEGQIVERCSQCHRGIVVSPTVDRRGIRAARLESGAPVIQMAMHGVR